MNGSDLFQVRSLSLNPFKGALYWSAIKNDLHVIEQSRMDGEDRKVLVSQRDQPSLHSPQSKLIFYLDEMFVRIVFMLLI